MSSHRQARRVTHMGKDKGPPDGPQLFPPSLKALKWSPIWRQEQKANAKLRESLPPLQYTPEQLKTRQLPADRLVDAIAAKARAETSWEREPEQVPERGPAQLSELEPAPTVEQHVPMPEQRGQVTEQPEVGKKHPGGRPPIPPALIRAAREEYRQAAEKNGHLREYEL